MCRPSVKSVALFWRIARSKSLPEWSSVLSLPEVSSARPGNDSSCSASAASTGLFMADLSVGGSACLCFQWLMFCVDGLGCFRRSGHIQNRVSSAKRVGNGFLGQRIGYPVAVHHQAIFVVPGRQGGVLQPATAPRGMHGLGFGMPVVESSRDTNAGGSRVGEFEVDRLQLRLGVSAVVVVFVVFHGWAFWVRPTTTRTFAAAGRLVR